MRFRGRERNGQGVKVAVIDSGIDGMDPRLAGHAVGGWNVQLGATGHALIGAEHMDLNGHGTRIASAISSVAPGVEFISVRIMDDPLRTSADLMAAGIETAFRNGARIINLSMGTPNMGKALLLRETVALAAEAGAIVLAAAHPRGERAYPADLPETVGVASHAHCGPGRVFFYDPDHFSQSQWGHLSGKFLLDGHERDGSDEGVFVGSELATAYASGILACISEAMPKATSQALIAAFKAKALVPVPELGYGQ